MFHVKHSLRKIPLPWPSPSPTSPAPASRSEIQRLSPEPLDDRSIDALFAHYRELALWNRRTNLIGPGTAGEILARHYGESLAALPLIPAGARRGLDLGSGAGFPGIVLAAAVRGSR